MRKLFFALFLTLMPMSAATIYNFEWDTSVLAGTNANFVLDVLLIGDVGNQASLSQFSYGGGSGPNLNVTLDTNVNFFNESMISFTPGSLLKFTLTVTNNAPLLPFSVPDTLSIYLLDSNLNSIPTTDAFASAILTLDLGPISLATFAGIDPLGFTAPSLTSVSETFPGDSVPEPSSLSLTLGALALWCLRRKKA
jgi:hypothetical protein